jgi:DegV family protein with EDD domain
MGESKVGKIKIITDSTADLSPELIQKHEIGVIPIYVTFGDETYRDGVDMGAVDLFKKVEECGKLPKTAAASPVDFVKFFAPYIEQGYDILYIALSSGLSSTFQNGVLAAQEFPAGRIEVVDSLNLSTGIGLLVMKAVDLVNEGLDLQGAAAKVRACVPKVETEFVIDTLDYLYKGGRCSALQNIISSMLRIRPLIKVVDGKMIVGDKTRGKRERALENMLERSLTHQEHMDLTRVFVTHSAGRADAEFLKAELEKRIQAKEIIITEAGSVISSHCGPNTVGILFLKQ